MRFISSFILVFIIIVLTGSTNEALKNYPQDYFRAPVGNTMFLSGTFGELRPNHFHSGIDIKGKVGQSLYAVADAYVSRIKIQEGGYGKVLYLRHPNGYTSVYAHMDKFDDAIEKYVTDAQHQKKTYEIELYPSANQFVFKKGQTIGKMGITGRSFGPHLHFEIRSSASERPINPLLFGLKVADSQAPQMHQLKIYHLNDKRETIKTRTLDLVKKGGGYGIKGDTINIGAWRAGFALKVYDRMNGVSNWNGIYALKMYQDDNLVFDFDMETFGFDETRYINAHLDYEEQTTKKSYFNRCYALPGNKLSIYNEQKEDGVVKLKSGQASKITMIAEDVKGNASEFVFWVKRAEVKAPSNTATFNYVLPYNEESVIENRSLKLYFPNGTFYENLYLQYQSSFDESYNMYSSVHHIHDATIPVHKYFDISILPTFMPEELKNKAFIAYCGKDNSVTNYGGQWKDGMLSTKVRDLGDYCIMVDNVKPKITPISFKKNLKGASKMTFKITDNVKTGGRANGLKYRATIDGQWILLEFDAKNDLLTHRFDKKLTSGEHNLVLVVTDNRGNEAIYERTFLR